MPQHVTMRWGYTGMNLPPLVLRGCKGTCDIYLGPDFAESENKTFEQSEEFIFPSFSPPFLLPFFTLYDFLLISK